MDHVVLLRWLHVIGACVLLGTGAGIAFFMVMADWVFTASAAIVQPITGALLAQAVGWKLSEGWIVLSLGLYVVTGAFWIPVVWMQHRMRDLAKQAMTAGGALPEAYHRLFRTWFVCGFPAFAAVLAIIWLMLAKPALTFG